MKRRSPPTRCPRTHQGPREPGWRGRLGGHAHPGLRRRRQGGLQPSPRRQSTGPAATPCSSPVSRHPDGETDPWWAHLSTARRPAARPGRQGVRRIGIGCRRRSGREVRRAPSGRPPGRCSSWPPSARRTNPAFRTPAGRRTGNAVALDPQRPGRHARGNTMTTPDLVMRQVLARQRKNGASSWPRSFGPRWPVTCRRTRSTPTRRTPTTKASRSQHPRDGHRALPALRGHGLVTSRERAPRHQPPVGRPLRPRPERVRDAVVAAAANVAPVPRPGPGADPMSHSGSA